jgi:hypothetical protein
MKRMLIVPFALLLLAGSAAASPILCPVATLGQYISDYSTRAGACQIGNLLFYDFVLTGSAGVASTTVTPDTTDPVTDPGIQFSNMVIVAGAGHTMDVSIAYKVATLSGSALIEDYSLSMITGSGAKGSGTVTVSFDNTGEKLFDGVGNFSGTPVSHIDLSPFVNGAQVTTAISVTGTTGFAGISIAQVNFSEQIPEPYEAVLIGSGLLLLGLRRIRVKPGA